MNLILMMLLDYMNNPHISIVDYTIAKYIVHHYTLIFDISINELADLLEVSISQISRFVRHIGFSSFQEFKEATRYHGENQRHSMIQKSKKLDMDIYQKYIQEETQYFFTYFDKSSLNNLVKDFHKFDKIALFGILNSGNAARELQYNLAFSGQLCISITEFQAQLSFIKNADSKTLIVIYSLSGEYVLDNDYSRYYHTIQTLKSSQSKIYVITNQLKVKSLSYIDEIIYLPVKYHLYQYTLQYFNDCLLLEYQKSIVS